jgi:glutaredoxin
VAVLSSLIATVVSAAFAVQLLRRYRDRGRTPATLYWGVSLTMFSLASLMLAVGVVAGWSAWSFRLFYLFGAVLNVPWLALGNIAINARRRPVVLVVGAVALIVAILSVRPARGAEPELWWPSVALAGAYAVALLTLRGRRLTRVAFAITLAFSIWATVAVWTAAFQQPLAATGLPEGRDLFPLLVRGTAVAGNAVGATLVVVSALASSAHIVWRRPEPEEVAVFRTIGRDRSYADALSRWIFSGRRGARGVGNLVRGNLLIAAGVALAAAGGLLSFLGDTTGHAVGLAVGVAVMYRGFVRTTRPPRVDVYTRRGCGLCRTAEAIVADEAGGAEIVLIDIDTDDELLARYHIRVPVVVVDGHEVAEGQIAPGTVRRALRRSRRRPRSGGRDAGQ